MIRRAGGRRRISSSGREATRRSYFRRRFARATRRLSLRERPRVPAADVGGRGSRAFVSAFVAHGVPPSARGFGASALGDETVEQRLHFAKRRASEGIARVLFGPTEREIVTFDVAFGSLRADP